MPLNLFFLGTLLIEPGSVTVGSGDGDGWGPGRGVGWGCRETLAAPSHLPLLLTCTNT